MWASHLTSAVPCRQTIRMATVIPKHQLLTQYQYSFIYRIADTEQHRSQQTEPESSYRRLEQGQRRYQHFCHLCLSTNSFNEELAKVAHNQVELSREQLELKEAYFKMGKHLKPKSMKPAHASHKTKCQQYRLTITIS